MYNLFLALKLIVFSDISKTLSISLDDIFELNSFRTMEK